MVVGFGLGFGLIFVVVIMGVVMWLFFGVCVVWMFG